MRLLGDGLGFAIAVTMLNVVAQALNAALPPAVSRRLLGGPRPGTCGAALSFAGFAWRRTPAALFVAAWVLCPAVCCMHVSLPFFRYPALWVSPICAGLVPASVRR
jgi:hypothetical protein